MKLSTKARYGARATVELGAVYPQEAVSARKVAERLGVSVKYLEQIMSALKAAGVLKSIRGVRGGYSLARPPSEVTLLEIFHVLEGEPLLVDCLRDSELCSLAPTCPTVDTWREMNDALTKILAGTTIQDLVDRARRKRDAHKQMYHI